MKILISTLIKGPDGLESVAKNIDAIKDPDLGVEIIAFTHDEGYYKRMERLLTELRCPVSFHGPYILTEGTSKQGSPEYSFLMSSYEKVLKTAAKFGVRHVVYHSTQITYPPKTGRDALSSKRKTADGNASKIAEIARSLGVDLLVENLPWKRGETPLYNIEQYEAFLERFENIDILIDIGHANMNGLPLESFLQKFGRRVKAYHFHNNDGIFDLHDDIFSGSFDYEKFAPIYKKYTPYADIVLEYEPHAALDLEKPLTDAKWIRERYS